MCKIFDPEVDDISVESHVLGYEVIDSDGCFSIFVSQVPVSSSRSCYSPRWPPCSKNFWIHGPHVNMKVTMDSYVF